MNGGVARKDGRFATGVLHLWHPPADRGFVPDNERKLDEAIRMRRVRALDGLSALASRSVD